MALSREDQHVTLQVVNLRIGEELRRLRTSRKLSLRAVAGELGIAASFLHDIERGKRRLSRIDDAERFFGVAPGHFAAIANLCPHCHGSGLAESA